MTLVGNIFICTEQPISFLGCVS